MLFPEAYYLIDTQPKGYLPVWIVLDSLDGLEHIPWEITHPWQVPPKLRSHCVVALKQTGPRESLLMAGIRNHIHLTVNQLKQLRGLLKFNMPKKGRGRNGAFLREDWVEGLVNHVCADLTEDERLSLVKGMAGNEKSSRGNPHATDILRAWNALDKQDSDEFQYLAQVAKDEALLQERMHAERVVTTAPEPRQHVTPRTLQSLLPQIGLVAPCRISRHPALKRYQCFYTVKSGTLDALTFQLSFICQDA